MNKENTQKWVDELIFGNHPQIHGDLYTDGGYCGLGVACLTYAQENNLDVEEVIEGSNGYLPSPVRDWLGLSDTDRLGLECQIVHMNDTEEYSLPNIGVYVRDKYLKDE